MGTIQYMIYMYIYIIIQYSSTSAYDRKARRAGTEQSIEVQ